MVKDRWGREVAKGGEVIKDTDEQKDTTINVNVDADKPETVVERKVEKKVVVEDDKSDDTPTPSTESA